MKTFTYKSRYCTEDNCHFEVGRYTDNHNLAIRVMSEIGETISTITVNAGKRCPDDIIFIKDYSENEGVYEWLVEMNMIEADPVDMVPSGWVILRSYKLTDTCKEMLGLGD